MWYRLATSCTPGMLLVLEVSLFFGFSFQHFSSSFAYFSVNCGPNFVIFGCRTSRNNALHPCCLEEEKCVNSKMPKSEKTFQRQSHHQGTGYRQSTLLLYHFLSVYGYSEGANVYGAQYSVQQHLCSSTLCLFQFGCFPGQLAGPGIQQTTTPPHSCRFSDFALCSHQ